VAGLVDGLVAIPALVIFACVLGHLEDIKELILEGL